MWYCPIRMTRVSWRTRHYIDNSILADRPHLCLHQQAIDHTERCNWLERRRPALYFHFFEKILASSCASSQREVVPLFPVGFIKNHRDAIPPNRSWWGIERLDLTREQRQRDPNLIHPVNSPNERPSESIGYFPSLRIMPVTRRAKAKASSLMSATKASAARANPGLQSPSQGVPMTDEVPVPNTFDPPTEAVAAVQSRNYDVAAVVTIPTAIDTSPGAPATVAVKVPPTLGRLDTSTKVHPKVSSMDAKTSSIPVVNVSPSPATPSAIHIQALAPSGTGSPVAASPATVASASEAIDANQAPAIGTDAMQDIESKRPVVPKSHSTSTGTHGSSTEVVKAFPTTANASGVTSSSAAVVAVETGAGKIVKPTSIGPSASAPASESTTAAITPIFPPAGASPTAGTNASATAKTNPSADANAPAVDYFPTAIASESASPTAVAKATGLTEPSAADAPASTPVARVIHAPMSAAAAPTAVVASSSIASASGKNAMAMSDAQVTDALAAEALDATDGPIATFSKLRHLLGDECIVLLGGGLASFLDSVVHFLQGPRFIIESDRYSMGF